MRADRRSASSLRGRPPGERQGAPPRRLSGPGYYRRPIFAWVIAIIIMLGARSVARCRSANPTSLRHVTSNTYPGASAETPKTVTRCGAAVTGRHGMLFSAVSSSSARSRSTSPSKRADPDIAQGAGAEPDPIGNSAPAAGSQTGCYRLDRHLTSDDRAISDTTDRNTTSTSAMDRHIATPLS